MQGLQPTNGDRRLTALLIQPMRGLDREPVYLAFWRADGGEEQEEIDRAMFWSLSDSAGEPAYSESNYWTYEPTS